MPVSADTAGGLLYVKERNCMISELADDVFRLIDDAHNQEEWSIQGLGMLRLYLDPEGVRRLHIWDPAQATNEVSTIHDHPWDFTSDIVSGNIINAKYLPDPYDGRYYWGAALRCGVGGGLVGEPERLRLFAKSPVMYNAGDYYSQQAEELHESFPSAGAVTVITRKFRPDNTDLARVVWKHGDWVSAEPRPATKAEVAHFRELALYRWSPDG